MTKEAVICSVMSGDGGLLGVQLQIYYVGCTNGGGSTFEGVQRRDK